MADLYFLNNLFRSPLFPKSLALSLLLNLRSVSFSQNKPSQEQINFKNFPQEVKRSFKKVGSLPTLKNGFIVRMHNIDSSIVFMESDAVNKYLYYSVNRFNTNKIEAYMPIGYSKYAIPSSFSDGVIQKENKLWAHDISTSKLLIVPLKKSAADPLADSLQMRAYRLPAFPVSVVVIDSVTILCSQFDDTSTSKLQLMDLRTGKSIKRWGSYEGEIPANMEITAWKNGNHCFLNTNPQKTKALLANRYADQIEIFDLEKNTSKLIKGPYGFDAVFTSRQSHQVNGITYFVAVHTENTRYGFMRSATTEKFIYLLFCGKPYNINGRSEWLGNDVFVYDWNGHPVKRITLNKAVRTITVTPDDKMLYSFDILTNDLIGISLQ